MKDEVISMIAPNGYWLILLPVLLMGLDILTGFIRALKDHELKSSKMREGFFKKIGTLILLSTVLLIVYVTNIPKAILVFTSIYVCVTEIISLEENIRSLGVKIPMLFTKFLEKASDTFKEE